MMMKLMTLYKCMKVKQSKYQKDMKRKLIKEIAVMMNNNKIGTHPLIGIKNIIKEAVIITKEEESHT